MSTNIRPTYEPQRQPNRQSTSRATETTETDSWVARCQQQFNASRTERIHNLVDRENQSIPRMRRDAPASD
ncbi:hypothetical protein E6P09_00215 [Haloferax mediterranei ATCC 33500]|uniref:Uncharacterized protein n=1 Tax=Haloferax mediterranei (strain ATCC 33500 / DSM 1411 / JCM 8866 / NBRC 14739 / NCIMB 2177 / R-4) TaxID=523841 RepID=M0IRQ4_HALMT|nr:hypothetical protein [Haloferax mediterranei]AHZ23358.1 hypothetical protein BM92_12240 [Haloferax mediterranei ATCC 33500]ELZ99526.1 hypothetical protein C439_13269 [Haloferax mediterranei ATCC 33500]MDX5987268.1 hypothetical protein [Haloferax mediterranei ATCC 33500]QCQ73790.1 hypothetical protein E6P09_00215 [Haloferax mediterranei ATCC 33500]